MEKQKYNITGMSCSACSAHVQKITAAVSGVQTADVNLLTNSMTVTGSAVPGDIIAAIEKEGYTAEFVEPEPMAVSRATLQKYNITGMSCSACSAHVQKITAAVSGVQTADVNLLTNSMTVTGSAVPGDIIAAIEKEGYTAEFVEPEPKAVERASPAKKDTNTYTEKAKKHADSLKKTLIISVAFLVPLMYVSMGHMVNMPMPSFLVGLENAVTFGMVQFLLTLPIMIANSNYFKSGFRRLLRGAPNMDSLIALGSSSAMFYGVFAIMRMGTGLGTGDMELVHSYHMDLYFESAGTILTLITVGKYFEAKSKGKTSEAITKLMALAPKTATVERDGEEVQVEIDELSVGDIVIVRPGQSVPTDGVITHGSSALDESALTGESVPAEKTVGDTVMASCVNTSGYLKIKATKVGGDTALAQIIRLVEEAGAAKAPIAKLADKISGVFVPVVICIAIVSAIVWLLVGQTAEFALSIAISVLVISCPCALGLATPVAIMVGTGSGAQCGVLIKSGESLQTAHNITHVVLDKTGTITYGKPKVTDVFALDITEEQLLKTAASLEKNSEHPVSFAITKHAEEKAIATCEVLDFTAIFGKGVTGRLDGELCLGGNEQLMADNNIVLTCEVEDMAAKYAENAKTPLFFAKGGKVCGIIAVRDTVKPTSAAAIAKLKSMGIGVTILTGDSQKTAETICREVGADDVKAKILPHQKEEEVRRLQAQGQTVAMVGDGINDAPALTSADVGIAIGAGTDIAIESADIVLIKNDLKDVVAAIRLAKAVMRNIKQNLFWAFFYNAIGIPLAAGIFIVPFALKLSPMFAAAAMSLSSVCVVANALRLRKFKG